MEKSVKELSSSMRFIICVLICFASGCASVQTPGYISRIDHPYEKKFYASFEKVTSSFMYVLKTKGWIIDSESDPSIYERDDRYDNNGYQNLLIITDARKHFLHLNSAHLNVFVHSLGNICDVEIRYESDTHVVKQFSSARNDQIVQGILDAVEQDING
jgi:hypothetical protein